MRAFGAFWGQVLKGTCTYGDMHQRGQVRKVHAYRGQVLLGTDVCCTPPSTRAFQEPRSRFPGACGGRVLMDLAYLPACRPL